MPVQSIRGVVEQAIQHASTATGVDFRFLMGTARRESGYNPDAKAKTSSAAGLFQFIDQTWLATLKRHGAKYGYAQYADQIQAGADGRFHVAGQGRQQVMNLRLDPHAASLMAGELAVEHASYLRGRVGRDPTAGELYVAHVLGPQGSARLIETVRIAPGANAAALFPEAAHANRGIFFPGGKPASVAQVYANLTQLGGQTAAAPAPDAPPDLGYVQFTSAARSTREHEEQVMIDLVLRGSQSAEDQPPGMRAADAMFSADMLRAFTEAKAKAT
ncbi:MAG: transglycosylase SLT domain-containing protein [Caulobacterales bacterium]